MRKSIFAMAAAAPLEMSIATAKRTDLAISASGPVDLTDADLDMVTGGQNNKSGFLFGQNSFQNQGQQQNATQNNFGGDSSAHQHIG